MAGWRIRRPPEWGIDPVPGHLRALRGFDVFVLWSSLGVGHRVPTMVSLRAVLGRRGSYVPTALNAVQLFGWAAFELLVMGLAAAAITGPFLGPATPYAWIVVFGLVCGLFAI